MPSQPLRIGLIGVGFGAQVHAPAFISEGCQLVAVAARRQERADAAAQALGAAHAYSDYRDLLARDDVDAVAIASSPAQHHEMSLAAFAAGKHVLCEKPFALDLAQAAEMRDAAEASGLTAMVAHEFRFAAARMRAKELIDEGYVGAPRLVRVAVLVSPPGQAPAGPPPFNPGRDDAAQGGGMLFALGSHYIDTLLHWFGPLESVSGDLFTGAERMKDGAVVKIDADNAFAVTLRFRSGALARMDAGFGLPFAASSGIEIYGDQGSLFLPQTGGNPPSHGVLRGGRRGDAAVHDLEIPERLRSFQDDRDDRLFPFRTLVRRFVEGVGEGVSPWPNFADGYRCQQALDAIREAAAARSVVAVA